MKEFNLELLLEKFYKEDNNKKLSKHLTDILEAAPSNTKTYFHFHEAEHISGLALVLKNDQEAFHNIHYFYMDIVDRKYGQYLYNSLPVSTLKFMYDHLKTVPIDS